MQCVLTVLPYVLTVPHYMQRVLTVLPYVLTVPHCMLACVNCTALCVNSTTLYAACVNSTALCVNCTTLYAACVNSTALCVNCTTLYAACVNCPSLCIPGYIESLPLINTPEVFGLHPNAEIGYYTQAAKEMWSYLIELQPQSGQYMVTQSGQYMVSIWWFKRTNKLAFLNRIYPTIVLYHRKPVAFIQ